MAPPSPHSDAPSQTDLIKWDKALTHISQRIEHCRTPHVLGVHGDWGSGKSSFMRQVQWHLGGEAPKDGSVESIPDTEPPRAGELRKKVVTIWFDAWRYQNEATPIVALLHEMRQQMTMIPAVRERMKKLGTLITQGVLDGISNAAKKISLEAIPNTSDIEKRADKWEKEHYADILASNSIRAHLEDAIRLLLGGKDGQDVARVVVFIDDLDRCNPKAAMRLLEGLKIYLNIPRCVFVLGMNERVLVDVIGEEVSPKGTEREELKLHASHYLEKICTDIYRLPLPEQPSGLLMKWIDDTQQRNVLALAIGNMSCLPPNPRRLKALANQWPLFAECLPLPPDSAPDEQKHWAIRVLIAAYIHQFNRDLWERLHFDINFWREIQGWCNRNPVPEPQPAGAIEAPTAYKPPVWAKALKLPHKMEDESSVTIPSDRVHHNPGDIDIFWIGSLIQAFPDLKPRDFTKLLNKHR